MYTRGMYRAHAIATTLALLAAPACAHLPPAPDPAKLGRALESMEKAADAVQSAIEDARDAATVPESVEAGEPEVSVSAPGA